MREACADDHLLRGGEDAASPAQVPGQRRTQRGVAERVGVAERLGRDTGHHPAGGCRPCRPGEGADVGLARTERPTRRGFTGGGRRPRVAHVREYARGYPGWRAVPDRQVALGGKVGVDGRHGPTRHTEVSRQRPGRGQRRTGGQLPVADRRTQRVAERLRGTAGRRPVQVEVDTGPTFWHKTGPYRRASAA